MHDVVKIRFNTARRWITYVLRLLQYLVLFIGGLYALVSPPDVIVDSLGRTAIFIMAIALLLGSALCFAGWGSGRWILEQTGAVAAAVGGVIYFWATMISPDVFNLGGGLRVALTLYVVVSLVLRVFELERYTSTTVVPGRLRLDNTR